MEPGSKKGTDFPKIIHFYNRDLPAGIFVNIRKSLILQGKLTFSGIITKIERRLVKFEENPAVEQFRGD